MKITVDKTAITSVTNDIFYYDVAGPEHPVIDHLESILQAAGLDPRKRKTGASLGQHFYKLRKDANFDGTADTDLVTGNTFYMNGIGPEGKVYLATA